MSTKREREYISQVLLKEVRDKFEESAKEYKQERDLGLRGEFAGLYRKARKLKTIVWDGESDKDWREGLRIIVREVISHGLLMLVDIDRESGAYAKWAIEQDEEAEEQEEHLTFQGRWANQQIAAQGKAGGGNASASSITMNDGRPLNPGALT